MLQVRACVHEVVRRWWRAGASVGVSVNVTTDDDESSAPLRRGSEDGSRSRRVDRRACSVQYKQQQRVTASHSELQRVTACYSVSQRVTTCRSASQRVTTCHSVLQRVTTCYNVLQRVVVACAAGQQHATPCVTYIQCTAHSARI